MNSLLIGGVSLPLTPLLGLSALLMLSGLNRLRRAPIAGLTDAILNRLLLSLLGARLLFVLQQWPAYRSDWLSIIDIRDRGFDLHAFLLLLSVLLMHYAWRVSAARQFLRWALPLVFVSTGGLLLLYRQFYPPIQAQLWPELTFQTLAAEPVRLQQLPQVEPEFTVVNLWASWCPPCRAEMPMLIDMQRAYPQGRIVLLNQGESAQQVSSFFQQEQLSADLIWLDPSGSMGRWVGQQALPLTLFFDRQGRLVDGHAGLLSRAMFEHKLKALQPTQPLPAAP